jgi:DHA1 family bicyclomycin/chloramphenicol resistance-like MFS transporter
MTAPLAKIQPMWLLVLITLTGTLGMHIFVPALSIAAADLGASSTDMPLAISIYMLGLALGQLLYGPISDVKGRLPVLQAGLVVNLLGSMACAFAQDLDTFLVARLIQSLGAAAGLVIGRTIVRDTSLSEAAVKRLALLSLMLMSSPALAPMMGGLVAEVAGWRSIFAFSALLALIALLSSHCWLDETLLQTSTFHWRSLLRDYWAVASSSRFLALAFGSACGMFSIFAFLAVAPAIFSERLGQPVTTIGVSTGLIMSGSAIGNLLTARLSHRVRPERLMTFGNLLNLLSILTMVCVLWSGQLTVAIAVAIMGVFAIGNGLGSPTALALVMEVHPRLVGSATGLLGCIQLLVGGLCTALATVGSDPAWAAVSVMAIGTLTSSLILGLTLRRRA